MTEISVSRRTHMSMVTYSDTGTLYGGEGEWTMLRASTRSQNYNTEWEKKQIIKEYIQQDAKIHKYKVQNFTDTFSGVCKWKRYGPLLVQAMKRWDICKEILSNNKNRLNLLLLILCISDSEQYYWWNPPPHKDNYFQSPPFHWYTTEHMFRDILFLQ